MWEDRAQAANVKKQKRSEQTTYIIWSQFSQLVPRAPVMGGNRLAEHRLPRGNRQDGMIGGTASPHLPRNAFPSDLPTTSATCFSELENQKFLLTVMSVEEWTLPSYRNTVQYCDPVSKGKNNKILKQFKCIAPWGKGISLKVLVLHFFNSVFLVLTHE